MQSSAARMQVMRILKDIWAIRDTCIIVLVPLLLCPLPIVVNTPAAKCGFVVIVMAIYWMTEALPLAVTALLPTILYPLLGVLKADEVSKEYLKDINMLFLAGLAIALSVENCNLHKRIALKVLILVGSSASRLMFGFLFITAFLSMWISNTACAAMMLPIAEAIIEELHKHYSRHYAKLQNQMPDSALASSHLSVPTGMRQEGSSAHLIELQNIKDDSDNEKEDYEEIPVSDKEQNISKGILLCVCYGANIGGTGTLTGTGTNLILQGKANEILGSRNTISFATWFFFAFPAMMVALILSWVWLQVFFLGWRNIFDFCRRTRTSLEVTISRVIKEKYEELGHMTFFENVVLASFIVLVFLWFFREPKFIPGWASFFNPGFVTDSTGALFIMVLLFILPRNRPKILCFRKLSDPKEPSVQTSVLTWKDMLRFPWGIILLLGGGFAMAKGVETSGLSKWMGEQMKSFQGVNPFGMVILCSAIVAAVTEVASNTATILIFVPVLQELALSMSINPLFLLVPATMAASYAFMFPVATPPSAIVFATGRLKVLDMMKCGFMMNVVCVLIVSCNTFILGDVIFDFSFVNVTSINITTTPLPVT